MENMAETIRALCWFLGINIIFFVVCIGVLATKNYFNLKTLLVDLISRLILNWPQP